jgi:cytochrome c nitrite reductase small subunit
MDAITRLDTRAPERQSRWTVGALRPFPRMTSRQKVALFFVILVFPALLSLVAIQTAFSRAQTVEFCGSCHTMKPWIDDVTGSESESLAAEHFRRRWIQHDQCYTCHSNYSFLGPIEAKIRGVQHVVSFYVGHEGPIHLYEEFPNANCLQCHEQAKGFREDSNHEPLEELLDGTSKCVECHDQLHDVDTEALAAEGTDAGAAAEAEAE